MFQQRKKALKRKQRRRAALGRALRPLIVATTQAHVHRAEAQASLYDVYHAEIAPAEWEDAVAEFDKAIAEAEKANGRYVDHVLAHFRRGRNAAWRHFNEMKDASRKNDRAERALARNVSPHDEHHGGVHL